MSFIECSKLIDCFSIKHEEDKHEFENSCQMIQRHLGVNIKSCFVYVHR